MQEATTIDPLADAMKDIIKRTDRKPERITPAEHRELSEGIKNLRPELRAAVFGALGPAVHELPPTLGDVGADLERAALLLPTGLPDGLSFLPPLLHDDGYKIAFAGAVAFVGPALDAEVTKAHDLRAANLPANLRGAPWHRLAPETWCDVRRTMAALAIREHGESSLPSQVTGSLQSVGRVELVSFSGELLNMIATVVRAEPVLGVAWMRGEAERRRSRETGVVIDGGLPGPLESLLRTAVGDTVTLRGSTLSAFEHRNEALIARVVAMTKRAPVPLASPELDESEVQT